MELGAHLLGQGVVGGVADQHVTEAVRVVPGRPVTLLSDQLLAHERVEGSGSPPVRAVSEHRLDGAAMEHRALHGRTLDHLAIVRRELVEARRQQHLNARRDRDPREITGCDPAAVLTPQVVTVDEDRDHLLDEQRVALGSFLDARGHVGSDDASSQEPLEQLVRLNGRQRLEGDRRSVPLASSPRRPEVEQIGARHRDEQDRRVARPLGDVLDEIEQRRLGPVQIVEDHDQGLLVRKRLEQAPHCPEPFFCGHGRVGEADELGHARGRHRSDVVAAEGCGKPPLRLFGGVLPPRCR